MIKNLKNAQQRMIYAFGVLTILFLSAGQMFSSDASGQQADDVLFEQGDARMTQKNFNELIIYGQFLARAKFSGAEIQALRNWAIEDFKSDMPAGQIFYTALSESLVPKIIATPNEAGFRANQYLAVVDSFRRHPEYSVDPNNFLAVVDRYDPPIAEAAQLQQLSAQLLAQQLQLNQMLFDQSMQQYQRSMDNVSQSIRDQATRYSITVPGGKILQEYDDRYLVEDPDGRTYDVIK